MSASIANRDQAVGWDGPDGEHWALHADTYEAALAPFRRRLVAAVPAGADVLDIGCGTGAIARDLGGRIASLVGVDLSRAMLARAARSALQNCRFVHADVQVHAFDASAYDVAVSSFGVMFFSDPVAAFANIRRALRPSGKALFLVWRALDRNTWTAELWNALNPGRDFPAPEPTAPGGYSLSDPDRAASILGAAGFVDLSFEPIDAPVTWGRTVEEAVAFWHDQPVVRGFVKDRSEQETRKGDGRLARTRRAPPLNGRRLRPQLGLADHRAQHRLTSSRACPPIRLAAPSSWPDGARALGPTA
ncbi:MAG: class I SAM-dependent methyltransferase [Nocardioides sp.]